MRGRTEQATFVVEIRDFIVALPPSLLLQPFYYYFTLLRHLLLRLQRELRTKMAADNRERVHAAKINRQTKVPYHRDCSTPGEFLVPGHCYC